MAISKLVKECRDWNYDEWSSFDNAILSTLPKDEQDAIVKEKNLFWGCYYANTPNAISEGEDPDPPDSYEQFLEETRKKQEQYIKNRGASFVFYHSFIEALEDMNDKEFRECILALCNYGLYQKKGEYKGMVKMYMTQAIPQLDYNKRRKLTNILNGQKGGAPLGNQNAKKG
jgi:hypothetical protein